MNRTDLADLINNGENSGVEFKRDDIRPEKLAKEMAALLNLEGGNILLGVEDNGTVSGLTRERDKAEEWVMEVARAHLRPAAIPYWETLDWGEGKIIGVVSLPSDAPDKPYKAKRGSAWVTQVRVGTTSRDATNEEEGRLYQQSGGLQYDRKPALGSGLGDLDPRRLVNYFRDVRRQSIPDKGDHEAWTRLLVNTEIMAEDRGRGIPSAGGLLLFGVLPNKYLPHAGVSAAAYSGTEKDYDATERATLRGPLVSLFSEPLERVGGFSSGFSDGFYPPPPVEGSEGGTAVEAGVIQQAIDFVRRNVGVKSQIDAGGHRVDRPDYPLEAVREAIVNAVAHRDYTITVCDIELSIYADRLEVISPGRLPNTVTVDKMRAGYRASRNELVKEILRDYGYVEHTGLGVPRKIVAGMAAHNGTDPDLIEEDDRFVVRLFREAEEG